MSKKNNCRPVHGFTKSGIADDDGYLWGLSAEVSRACNAYFRRKGMPVKTMQDMIASSANRRNTIKSP